MDLSGVFLRYGRNTEPQSQNCSRINCLTCHYFQEIHVRPLLMKRSNNRTRNNKETKTKSPLFLRVKLDQQ
jgi:hypothetical protein